MLPMSLELTERYVFPASNAGAPGTSFFITTVDIVNWPVRATASIRLQLLPRNSDNSASPRIGALHPRTGQVRRFDNVLGEAFGSDGDDVAGGAAVACPIATPWWS